MGDAFERPACAFLHALRVGCTCVWRARYSRTHCGGRGCHKTAVHVSSASARVYIDGRSQGIFKKIMVRWWDDASPCVCYSVLLQNVLLYCCIIVLLYALILLHYCIVVLCYSNTLLHYLIVLCYSKRFGCPHHAI